MKQTLGINPWLSVWVKPKETIRALIQYNVKYRFLVLCGIYGFQFMLHSSQFFSLGYHYSMLAILLFSFILAIPIGYLFFTVLSFFLLLLGKILKGKGHFQEIRAATYWSNVPMIGTIFLWFFLMIIHGNALFVAGYAKELTTTELKLNVGIAIAQLIFGIWALVIFLKMLGEVQGFSVWKALLNAFLAYFVMIILIFLGTWGITLAIGAM